LRVSAAALRARFEAWHADLSAQKLVL
jgi:hypothetical protein